MACATKVHDGKAIRMFIGTKIISKFGTPKRIIMDCGREFVSQNTQAYLKGQDIEHHTTTPYHPQANGRVERLNGVLLSASQKLSSEDSSSWPKHLTTALLMA